MKVWQHHMVGLTLLAWVHGAGAACNADLALTRPDSRYEAVAGSGGAEVRDKVTGLIWQRCLLGMSWDGSTCTGTASTHTWTQALDAARTATASPVAGAGAWRVPNHKELFSLAERACSSPALNSRWFPGSHTYVWSSSPNAVDPALAQAISFQDGSTFRLNRDSTSWRVRLVR
ncbi:MAG: hypothetical protein RL657_247 [Pseudomonadota bacterium]|jgi:Protein of unknown function (DUF1566)